jgi:hypothetical protein
VEGPEVGLVRQVPDRLVKAAQAPEEAAEELRVAGKLA